MRHALNLEAEAFEGYSELDEIAEEALDSYSEWETEQNDSEGQVWRGRRISTLRAPIRPGMRPYRTSAGARLLPKRPPRPTVKRVKRRPWPTVVVHEPTPCYCPAECPTHGTEYVRWVQSALNDVLGLRLPVNGILGPESRSAIHSFQERGKLPVTGIVGPDTERALIAARGGQSSGAGATKPAEAGMTEPATTPPGPGKAEPTPPAAEFDFEWENFDDERELNFPEFEFEKEAARPPRQTPKLSTKTECPAYAKGEIEKSKTQKGHLPSDVIPHARGLLIADFGVDWRHIKESTKKERLLKDWLSAAKSDLYSIFLRIYGYSDCVGNEKNNMYVRRERAKRVHALLDKDLQSRIDFVGPARAGEYVTDNSTVEGRAKNRGVIIELLRFPTETIEITEPAPSNKISKGWTLVGETVDYYYVRETPNGKILGSMTGTPTPLTIEGKAYVGGKRWYQIILRSRMQLIKDIDILFPKVNLCEFASLADFKRGSVFDFPKVKNNEIELPAGTRCWVNEKGVDIIADWGLFKRQLREFEAANKNLNLDARITMLRQMGQPSDLPFDAIIGTPKGKLYFENHPFVKDEWQILRDYQKVRMPDGRDVDVYHLFVGLDVLTKKVESKTFSTIDLGPNYSAATWAGDIGAGAADATISKLEKTFRDCWANLYPHATDNERLEHYYNTRAPESDLLGDIDAWGIHALRVGPMDTIEKLLISYYEDTYDGSQRVLTIKRKDAIEWFLIQYGFKYREKLHLSQWPSALLNQQRVAMRVEWHIHQFALIWMLKKIWSKSPFYKGVKPANIFVSAMTAKFLQWLEYQVIENGAVV